MKYIFLFFINLLLIFSQTNKKSTSPKEVSPPPSKEVPSKDTPEQDKPKKDRIIESFKNRDSGRFGDKKFK